MNTEIENIKQLFIMGLITIVFRFIFGKPLKKFFEDDDTEDKLDSLERQLKEVRRIKELEIELIKLRLEEEKDEHN